MSASSTDEVTQLAINLARNAGYAVLPCRADKSPACPHGFRDASKEPSRILELWHHWPAELIGIATDTVSQLWVVDVDVKHPEACHWWRANHHRLLPTRTYATRSGGLHLYYHDADGIGCSTGRICRGVDTRGDGGYVIYWFATGLACHDHSPPAPWPAWLRDAMAPPPRPIATSPHRTHVALAETAVAGIVRRVAEAREGGRNALLFWAACRLLERGIPRRDVEALLLPTAINIGLTEMEARRTITSAEERAVA
jgi:Bifunctional DNA primase/polymerase, N-terminal